jgi:uncharacterized protein YoxC
MKIRANFIAMSLLLLVCYYLFENKKLQTRLDEQNQKLGTSEMLLDKKEKELEEANREIAVLKEEVVSKEAEVNALRRDTGELRLALKTEQTVSRELERKVVGITAELMEREAELDALKKQVILKNNEIRKIQEENAKLQQQIHQQEIISAMPGESEYLIGSKSVLIIGVIKFVIWILAISLSGAVLHLRTLLAKQYPTLRRFT